MSDLKQKELILIRRSNKDLLMDLIRGKRFQYKQFTYSFDRESGDFKQALTWVEGDKWKEGDEGNCIESIATTTLCSLLVGKCLVDAPPVVIPVDTLLLVSDSPIIEGTPSKSPLIPRYFSHWLEGHLYCFKDGSNSVTATATKYWMYWQYHDPIIPTDKTDDNAEIKNNDPFMDRR